MVPFVTLISSAVKLDVISLVVKVNAIVVSFVTLPSLTPLVLLVIAMVGTVVSTTIALLSPSEPLAPGLDKVKVALFNAASLTVPEFKVSEFVET